MQTRDKWIPANSSEYFRFGWPTFAGRPALLGLSDPTTTTTAYALGGVSWRGPGRVGIARLSSALLCVV